MIHQLHACIPLQLYAQLNLTIEEGSKEITSLMITRFSRILMRLMLKKIHGLWCAVTQKGVSVNCWLRLILLSNVFKSTRLLSLLMPLVHSLMPIDSSSPALVHLKPFIHFEIVFSCLSTNTQYLFYKELPVHKYSCGMVHSSSIIPFSGVVMLPGMLDND